MTQAPIVPLRQRGFHVAALVAGAALALSVFSAAPALAAKAATKTLVSSTTTTSPSTTTTDFATVPASAKVAADLQAAISAAATPTYSSWVRDINGVRHVKAIVVASASADPELSSLRQSVLALGGSVYFRYTSVTALSVLLPARRVIDIAALADVQGISPNRMTARTATSLTPSLLEQASGASGVRTRSGTAVGYSGLDGSGVGIAVLDSGVMPKHQLFNDAAGVSRVRKSVNFLLAGDATAAGTKDWTPGVDTSASLYPGSPTMATYEAKIDGSRLPMSDAYGHGTHVAAVAAGRDFKQTLDTTGIAPGASLFDIAVLDHKGFGQLSDVLAGIDWVI
ncbi:MAG: S8 family serine peptidase [Rubrivivax sp.]|nr:S8 family serine peptidase [Rubrivivax sp.]